MANPTWFDAKNYIANKLAQLKATEPTADWTEEKLTKAMEENGFKGDEGAYAHFTQFGEAENVSPNALFNVKEYLAAKAKQLTDMNVDGKIWTEVSVMDAIKAGQNRLGRDGRILVRLSGTEPLIRVMAEGKDAGEIEETAQAIAGVIRERLA